MRIPRTTTRLQVSGPLPPDEVWERYARPDRWATWSPQIRGVEAPERISEGARGVVRGPLGLRVAFVVDAVDEVARTWTWTVRAAGTELGLRHAVRPGPDGRGTTTELEVRGPAPVVVAYLPVAGLALARLVRRPG